MVHLGKISPDLYVCKDLMLDCMMKEWPFDGPTNPSDAPAIKPFQNRRGLETGAWQEEDENRMRTG